MKERYLGDSVYAYYDGYYVILDGVVNGHHNRIYLEPRACDAFTQFVQEMDQVRPEQTDGARATSVEEPRRH